MNASRPRDGGSVGDGPDRWRTGDDSGRRRDQRRRGRHRRRRRPTV